jgi:hypothetical protein
VVTLDGSESSDPDSTPGTNDDIVLFEWFENFGIPSETFLGNGEVLNVLLSLGAHIITLRVTDSGGDTSAADVIVTVADTLPPTLSVVLMPNTLWPPNHHMVDVTATVVADDSCGPPMLTLTSIASDEADNGQGDGNTVNDIQEADVETADFQFKLRAERAGGGDGRIYTAVYTATDGAGNSATEAGFVVVPHDQGGVVEPIEVGVVETDSGSVVTWGAVTGVQTFDVIRGDLSAIAETPVVINLGSVACIEDNSGDLNTVGWDDSASPPPNEGFFYLVEYNDGTGSSYGTESVGKPRAAGAGDCE